MFKSSFKLAWRNLLKDRQFTFLNLIGLSTGLACALLISSWVYDELSFDKFHDNESRLFQVMRNEQTPNNIKTYEGGPGVLATAIAKEMPEVENAVAFRPGFNKGIASVNGIHIKAREEYAGASFFNVFSYKLIQGNKNQVLLNKNGIAISEDLALKLFNNKENNIGKTIQWDDNGFSGSYFVSGVFENIPNNSSEQFDLLFSYDLFLEKKPQFNSWGNNNPNTYITLKKDVNAAQFSNKIAGFVKSKLKGSNSTLFLRKYSDKYLHGKYENGAQAGGRIQYVKLFSIIALFILVIACINFMNLSTAKASRRMKEVGIKKVMGANKQSLIFQYMTESILMAFASLLFSLLLVAVFLPEFNQITGKHISFLSNTNLLLWAVGIALITGLISGSYPAFYLSGFKPIAVLKGELNTSLGELWVRKGLVIFQFTLSAIFIVSVLVVYKQMDLVQTKHLGYNTDNIICFEKGGKVAANLETFLSEIKKLPGIVDASNMGYDFAGGYGFTSGVSWEGKNPSEVVDFGNMGIGYGLIETLGYKIKEGRAFSKEFKSDSTGIILNESAINIMGIKKPIGKIIELWGEKRNIVGVVKDFHFESLYEKIKPCFMRLSPGADKIVVKIKAGNERGVLAGLQSFYKTYTQGDPFDYKFMDEAYDAQYAAENRVAALSRYFAGLAIIISCLGLFGLAAFTAQKKQKEICIRKIIGASASNITALLSVDFLKLVSIALLIAMPFSWWAANQWLESFAYRINLGAGIFILAAASTIVITLMTISFQTIKAAVANPMKSLRTE